PSCPVPAPQCSGPLVPAGSPQPFPAPPHPHSSGDPQSQRGSSPPAPGCVAGSHTVQQMYGCDLLEGSGFGGFFQVAYDGRDFIALDKN
ncbi:HA1F protein, partial [Alectura lathami]|nr:HA1F protein [Alectura lathami]